MAYGVEQVPAQADPNSLAPAQTPPPPQPNDPNYQAYLIQQANARNASLPVQPQGSSADWQRAMDVYNQTHSQTQAQSQAAGPTKAAAAALPQQQGNSGWWDYLFHDPNAGYTVQDVDRATAAQNGGKLRNMISPDTDIADIKQDETSAKAQARSTACARPPIYLPAL